MKTKSYNVYKFNELSEESQQKAIENLYDINVDYDWWESTHEDAKTIGLEITEFDIDRGADIVAPRQNIRVLHGARLFTRKFSVFGILIIRLSTSKDGLRI